MSPSELDLRRNPFKWSPTILKKKEPKSKANALLSFPLEALKFVGTLSKGKKIWALIKQPDGIIARVSLGGHLGINRGRILFIEEKRLQVEEDISNLGQKSKQITSLNIELA